MISFVIDAKENRYIVLSEIPVVFLHADMEDNLHMLLEVTIAEMINELDPTICRKHIGSTNKESQCYMYNLKSPSMGHSKQLFF